MIHFQFQKTVHVIMDTCKSSNHKRSISKETDTDKESRRFDKERAHETVSIRERSF